MSIDRRRAHWGLSRTPFTKELATSMLFASAGHQEAVARVGWIVSEWALGVVRGEVGAGKTVAARAATASLDSSRYSIIYLPNPAIGVRGIYTQIVTALGATPRFYRATLIPQATDLLAAETAERGKTVVLILDEAPHTFATKQIQVAASPTAIANEYARLWVRQSDSAMTVLAGDGALNGTVKLPGAGSPLAISSSIGVWVVRGAAGLSRVDPRTEVAIRTTPPYQYLVHPGSPKVGGDPRDVGALANGPGDNTIWVISRSDHLLSPIGTLAPTNEKVLATIPVGSAPDHLAVAAHVVWVDDPPAKALYEVTYSN